jgi:hypothetical protein
MLESFGIWFLSNDSRHLILRTDYVTHKILGLTIGDWQ